MLNVGCCTLCNLGNEAVAGLLHWFCHNADSKHAAEHCTAGHQPQAWSATNHNLLSSINVINLFHYKIFQKYVYRRGQMKLEYTLLGTIASCHNRRRQSLHFSSSLHRISALTFNFWQQIPLLMSPNVRLEPSLFGTRHRVNPFN